MERAIVLAAWGWAVAVGQRAMLMAVGALLASPAAVVAAQAPPARPHAVVWLDHAAADTEGGQRAAARERALRLELRARTYELLESRPSDRGGALDQQAMTLLARTTATAVLWIEADEERPVSWLHVRVRQRERPAKSPLPHPPDAIEPQLLAIAAASLLDQALREPKRTAAVPTPARTAALAPRSPSPQAEAAPPSSAALPEPARDHFVQLGFALPFAAVSSGMEASLELTAGIEYGF